MKPLCLKDSQSSTGMSDLQYQAFKLKKILEERIVNARPTKVLKKACGLDFIAPDDYFNSNLILQLLPPDDESNPSPHQKSTNCEILIHLAMQNESSELFISTMNAINENLEHWVESGINPKKIACVIIVDGISNFMKAYEKEKDFFKDFFDEQIIMQRFQVTKIENCEISDSDKSDQDEFAHCFAQKRLFGNCSTPLSIIFCVKHHTKRKLNTHLWFFGGFCSLFQPKYVMMLDVGVTPLPRSLFYLYEALECDLNLAGCCGELKALNPNYWRRLIPPQAAEYKFFHMLDKASESVLGFVTVLPVGFSAFRWEAFSDQQEKYSLEDSPLWGNYFKSICNPELMDNMNANIYLAEDRVLSLPLFTTPNKAYVLRYVKKSVAQVPFPESFPLLMMQRKKWINGAMFALIDSFRKCGKICKTSHRLATKFGFILQTCFYCMSVTLPWFIVGIYSLAIRITIKIIFHEDNSALYQIGNLIFLLYICIIILLIVLSLSIKPKRIENVYRGISAIFAIYQTFLIGTIIWLLISSGLSYVTLGFIASAVALAIITCLNGEILTVIVGGMYYILLQPTFINVLSIYAVCNIHDCTWECMPEALNAEERKKNEEFEGARTKWLLLWAYCNSLLFYVVSAISNSETYELWLFGIVWISNSFAMVKVFLSIMHIFDEWSKKKPKDKRLLEGKEGKKKKTTAHRGNLPLGHSGKNNNWRIFPRDNEVI